MAFDACAMCNWVCRVHPPFFSNISKWDAGIKDVNAAQSSPNDNTSQSNYQIMCSVCNESARKLFCNVPEQLQVTNSYSPKDQSDCHNWKCPWMLWQSHRPKSPNHWNLSYQPKQFKKTTLTFLSSKYGRKSLSIPFFIKIVLPGISPNSKRTSTDHLLHWIWNPRAPTGAFNAAWRRLSFASLYFNWIVWIFPTYNKYRHNCKEHILPSEINWIKRYSILLQSSANQQNKA